MKIKKIIIAGCTIIVLLSLACVHSIFFNEGRIVYPMDYSEYAFEWLDLPILLAVLAAAIFVIYLMAMLGLTMWNTRNKNQNSTRKLNPKLGFLGLLGLLGFTGFWTYSTYEIITPFIFFIFLGFFGFFFEGKMSGTFMDERFRENAQKAQLKACKVGFFLQFIVIWLAGGQRILSLSIEHSAIFMLSFLSVSYALVIFLSEYFLYRFDYTEEGQE